MTAVQEQVTCYIPDLNEVPGYEVRINDWTMPETLVALRATSWWQEERTLRKTTSVVARRVTEALAHNVRELSKHACAVTARTDFSDVPPLDIPEHPFAMDLVIVTTDFSAVDTRVLPKFLDDEAPTIVAPPRKSIEDFRETEMLFLRPSGDRTGDSDPGSIDPDDSVPITPIQDASMEQQQDAAPEPQESENAAARPKKTTAETCRQRLLDEMRRTDLIVLNQVEQRVVRHALNVYLQNGASPHDRDLAIVAMGVPALTGTWHKPKHEAPAPSRAKALLGSFLMILSRYGRSHPAVQQASLLQ